MGMLYGYKHKDTVAKWRAEERIVEKEMKEKYLLDKEAAKNAANIEFAKTSMLYGFSEENPGVIVDGKVVSQEEAAKLQAPGVAESGLKILIGDFDTVCSAGRATCDEFFEHFSCKIKTFI